MAAQTFRLTFNGKIAPEQDLAQVKVRMQQLFKKDAATIDQLFSGKKVTLKQGLNQSQAIQYKEKLRALGILCEMVGQGASQKPAAVKNQKNRLNGPVGTRAANKPLKFADIDKAFTDHLPKFDPSFAYKAGIVAVGLTMVLLPVLYLVLIMLVGYGVLYHGVVNTGWMQSFGYKLGTVAYVTPLVVGVTVILFMLKPLFAKPADEPKTTSVDPLQEPLFIHFVNKIALAVGAPRPKLIQIDCDVNASAGFHRGLFGFISNELVLTIGMPLIAGLNARQLAGILAHEFGHFSQGAGMRFHYLTYKINSWLFNAVYTRDTWDQKLDSAAAEAPDWLHIILNIARAGVWATRKVLTVFMMTGHAVSSYMLRQMEFDADRYEIYLAGSEQFRDTTLQLQRLGMAYQISHDHLAKAWEEKKLVNDFPSLIAHNAEQLSPQAGKALLKQMEQEKTGVYDSHPSDKQRIDKASQEGANGVFNLNCEGRDLLKAFASLAKRATIHHYANDLGLEFEKDKLVDVDQVVKITRDHEHQQEAYRDYFKEMTPVFWFPLSVNIFDASKLDWDKLIDQYKEVNDRIANEAVSRSRLMSQVNKAYRTYLVFDTIDLLKQGGLVMLPEWFDLNDELYNKHKAQLEKADQTWQQFMQQLTPMFELNDQRLSIALTLLNHPQLIERNKDHAQHLKMRNRLSLLINNFKRNTDTILDFEYRKFRLLSFLSCARVIGQKAPQVQEITDRLMQEYKQAFSQLSNCLHRLDYPFVGEGEHETVAGHLETLLPKRSQCGSEMEYYLSSGNVIEEKLEVVYERIMSGLAAVALTVDYLLPTLNQEPESQIQQPQAMAQDIAQGSGAATQTSLAFASSGDTHQNRQDKSEDQPDSAAAFYEAALMGSTNAGKHILPEDMNPGAAQTVDTSVAKDKAEGATEAIKNLMTQPQRYVQIPADANAQVAETNVTGTKVVEQHANVGSDAGRLQENTGSMVAETKSAELPPATGVNSADIGVPKAESDSKQPDTIEPKGNAKELAVESQAGKPALATENRLQAAASALQEKAAKTKAAIIAANAAGKSDFQTPAEQPVATAGESLITLHDTVSEKPATTVKKSNTIAVDDPQGSSDGAASVAVESTGAEMSLEPVSRAAQPSASSGQSANGNAESGLGQDTGEAIATNERNENIGRRETNESNATVVDRQATVDDGSVSQSSSGDAMAQSIDHLKQTINNLSLEPRDDLPTIDAEAKVARQSTGADSVTSAQPDTGSKPVAVEHAVPGNLENETDLSTTNTSSEDTAKQLEYMNIDQTVIGVMAAMEDIDEELPWGSDDNEPRPDFQTVISRFTTDGSETDKRVTVSDMDIVADDEDDDSPALTTSNEEHSLNVDDDDLSEEDILAASSLLSVGEMDNDTSGESSLSASNKLNGEKTNGSNAEHPGEKIPEKTAQSQQSAQQPGINTTPPLPGVNATDAKEPADRATTRVTANDRVRAKPVSSTVADSNERLSQALEKMAEKRSHLQAYLSQVTKVVVEPGMETAARYESIKSRQAESESNAASDIIDHKDNSDGGVQPYLSAPDMSLANKTSPMSDHLSKLKQVTENSRKFTSAHTANPVNETGATDDDKQFDGRDSASQQ